MQQTPNHSLLTLPWGNRIKGPPIHTLPLHSLHLGTFGWSLGLSHFHVVYHRYMGNLEGSSEKTNQIHLGYTIQSYCLECLARTKHTHFLFMLYVFVCFNYQNYLYVFSLDMQPLI